MGNSLGHGLTGGSNAQAHVHQHITTGLAAVDDGRPRESICVPDTTILENLRTSRMLVKSNLTKFSRVLPNLNSWLTRHYTAERPVPANSRRDPPTLTPTPRRPPSAALH